MSFWIQWCGFVMDAEPYSKEYTDFLYIELDGCILNGQIYRDKKTHGSFGENYVFFNENTDANINNFFGINTIDNNKNKYIKYKNKYICLKKKLNMT